MKSLFFTSVGVAIAYEAYLRLNTTPVITNGEPATSTALTAEQSIIPSKPKITYDKQRVPTLSFPK